MKQASVRFATARAHRVFPVPGGPNSSTPFGGSIPKLTNRSGWGVTDIGDVTCGQRTGGDWLNFTTHVKKGGLHHFSEFLDLLFTSTHIAVGHIRLFLYLHKNRVLLLIGEMVESVVFLMDKKQQYSYLHHSDCWVDLGRQRNMNLIFVSVNSERTNAL